MLEIKLDKQFKKDIKRDQNSGKYQKVDFDKLKIAMGTLIEAETLDDKYLSHHLLGNWRGYSECHIKPNWLLIYRQDKKTINFARLGTHQQLFKKF